jgi:large subunit ribosomal protein L6
MSRIGKKTIEILKNVEVKIQGQDVFVKGPKGELSMKVLPEIKVEKQDEKIIVQPLAGKEKLKTTKAFWGLTRMLINNMVEGVVNGFEKKLEIKGVGYKAELSGKQLVLNAGFSHQVKLDVPEQITVLVEKNIITVSGIDKQLVGQFASNIRKVRPAEPYKGKGIKYLDETIVRKAGKKVATTK